MLAKQSCKTLYLAFRSSRSLLLDLLQSIGKVSILKFNKQKLGVTCIDEQHFDISSEKYEIRFDMQ